MDTILLDSNARDEVSGYYSPQEKLVSCNCYQMLPIGDLSEQPTKKRGR